MKNVLRTLPVTIKNGTISLNLKLADVQSMAIVGVDLVALMRDGTRLLLPGLAVRILERPSPALQFLDQQLSGADLFTKVDIDSTALKDATEALQVPVSEPTSSDNVGNAHGATEEDGKAGDAAAGEGTGDLSAGAVDGLDTGDASKGESDNSGGEPQAWYQEYGWILGLVGLAGLALGLSGGNKKGKDEDKPAEAAQPDAPAGDTPDDGNTPPTPPDAEGGKPAVTVTGGIAAGVFNHAETLSVTLYGAQGQELARGELVVGPNGQVLSYRAELPADYVGPVRVVITDGARDGLGFIDEYRQALALGQGMTAEQAERFASADFAPLSAIAWRTEDQMDMRVSVTPLTELAARLLQVPADPTQALDGVTAEQLAAMAAAVADFAKTFTGDTQINDILGPVIAINADNFGAGAADAQAYGRALAGLAGLDAVSGALEQTLRLLTRGLERADDGTLRVAQSVEGAILLSAMQQANTLLAGLDDHSLFDVFALPEVPWSTVTAAFADAAPSEVIGIDALGSATQPAVTVSWDADGGARLAAGQTVALYLLDGRQVAAHTLSDEDIAAGHLTLNAPDYGEQALGADGVKRLFVTVADDAGLLIARSELHTYGLVSAEVDAITGLSADTGLSNSDFITNQPVQAVSGTYRGTLGENTHIEVSADGGRTWVATRVTAGADGAGGTWVSESLRLDATAQDEDARLLTRVSVSGGDGEQALMLAGASHDFVLDVTPPEAVVASIDSISAPLQGALDGFLFSQASQTIRGTVDGTLAADERVLVSIDGGNTWIAGEADGANWHVTVGFSKHGPGEILARVSDVAGNFTAALTHPYQFTEASLEGVIPTQAVDVQAVTDHIGDSQADPYDFMGELRPGMSTDDRRPTFTGTVSADLQGDQVLVLVDSINGGPERLLGYANVAPGEDGQLPQWSFTPVADMAVGRHQVLVKVFSPSQNAWSAPYPEGVDANTPDAKSNWGAWDVNVQSITFDGVIIPGVDPMNLLTAPSLVTESTQPILTGILGSLLGPDESVMIYDTADNGRPMLLGAADILPEQNGAGARWRFEFRDDAHLRDGAHTLRAVIQQPDDDNGVPRSLLSAGTPPVIVSTELPEQEVTIARIMDDVGIYTGEITSGASTDDTTPSLTGSVSAALRPGQTLQVRITDVNDPERVFTYEPQLDQDSLNWSLVVSPALPVGHYHLAAGVVNGGGAMGARSAHFDLLVNSLTFTNLDDATGPIVGNVFASGEPFVTDDRVPAFGGQLGAALADGEVVQVVARHDNKETVLGNATISIDDKGGLTWYLALDNSQGLHLEDGQSTLSARVVNVDSDEVRMAVDREIVVDAGIPDTAVAITEVRDRVAGSNGFVGPLAAGQSTDDARPLISGMLLGGATTMPPSRAVQIIDRVTSPSGTVTKRVLGLATMDKGKDGTWTFTPPENLAIGSHAFSARVINIANRELGPESASIAVRENRLSFASILDHVGALQGNLLDARIFAQPVSTDDSRPSMSGELGVAPGPNERVAIYDSLAGGPATRLGVATVTGTSWVFRPENTLSDGVHTFQARLERTPPGHAPQVLLSASTPSITIDGTAVPVTQTMLELRVSDNNGANGSQTGVVAFRGSTDDPRPVVSGRLSAPLTAGLQVQVFASSAGNAERLLGTAQVNGVNWTYQIGQNLPFGPATILARVVANNSGLTSNTLFTTVNINGIAVTEIAETATGVNLLDRDGHGTGLNDVTLHGRLSAPLLAETERVAVYAKDGDATLFSPIGLATVASNGIDWTFHLPERQGTAQTWREGRHELSVRIEDSASRVPYALVRTDFTVDSQPPTQTASITGYIDAVGTSQGVLTNGVSTDETRGVIQGTLSAPIDTHTRRVMVYARAADGSLVLLGEAGVTNTDWKFQSVQNFVPGLHTLLARVENIATGGVGASSDPFDVRVQQVSLVSVVDPVAPDVNILAPAFNGAAKHGALVVGGHLGAALAPGEEVKIFIDGEEQAGAAAVTSGLDWSFTLPADTPLAQGSHTIVAQVVGADGAEIRVGSTASTVYIDNNAPVETVIISSARDNQGAGGLSFTGENVSGVASDDPLPRLQGTVSAPLSGGAAVAVYGQMPGQDAPVFLGFADVAADATWTFQVGRELPLGDTVFTARAVNRADPQNLQGASSPAFVVHEQAVSITALVDHHGAVTGDLFQAQAPAPARGIALLNTDDLRPTLHGRVAVPLKAGEVLTLFRGTTRLGEAVFESDGLSWSFTPPADVAQGTAPFSAVLLDFAGRSLISARTPDVTLARLGADHTITITAVQDTNNRLVMVDRVMNTAPVNVLADGLLDDSRPTLSGTLDRPLATTETVHVYAIDSQGGKHDLGAATTTGSNWSLTAAISLPTGMNTLQAAIENGTDRNDAVLSTPVKVNVVSPSGIELDDMSAWGAVPSGRPTMHGSVNTDATENLSVRILIDGVDAGTVAVEAGGSWTFQPVFPLAVGTHQVEYVLLNNGTPVDAVQTEAPRAFTVSGTEAPSFSVTLAGDGQPILTDQALVVLSGTASEPVPAGMGIMISLDNKDVGLAGMDASGQNWSYTLWAQLPGQHAIAARPINLGTLVAFEDGAAHTSVFQNQMTIDTPTEALALSGGLLAMLASNDKDVTLTGRLTGELPTGSWLQVRRDDVALGRAEIAKDGSWHYAITPDQQAIGTHRYSVLALPAKVDTADAQADSPLRAQAQLNFTDARSGPDAQLYVAITSLTDDRGVNVPATNAVIHNPLPAVRGTISQALDPLEQIVVYGRDRDGQQTRLGEVRMLTATTWEFQVTQALPQGGYTLIAKPENRLTHVANEIGSAATNIQLQDVTIVTLTDAVGAQRGNVLDVPGHLTDDGLPTISGMLSAPLREGEQYLRVSDTVGRVTTVLGRAEIADPRNPLAWRFQPTAPLANGSHTISVEVAGINNDSVQAGASVSIMMDGSTPGHTVQITRVRDDDGPITGNAAVNGAIAYQRPLVSGTVSTTLSNAQVVRIWGDDGAGTVTYLGQATVNGTNWTWRSDTDMDFGSVQLFATVDNAAKSGVVYNEEGAIHGRPSAPFSFRLQDIQDVHLRDADGKDVDASTSSRQFTLSGKLATPLINGEYIEIRDGASILGRATVDDDLNWRFPIGESLINGRHAFKISILGNGNPANTPLVYVSVSVNVHEAAPDPLQAGLIEAVIALPGTQVLTRTSPFDFWAGNSVRPGQSVDGARVGMFGTLAVAPRAGDLVQVYDNDTLLGTANVSGLRWWYNADKQPFSPGEHRLTLTINGMPVPPPDSVHDAVYPIEVFGADAIRIDALTSQTDRTQALSGSLQHALGRDEVLGVYRTLNGEKVRLGDATVQQAADAEGRVGWSFTPTAGLGLGLGEQTLTLQVEGATHTRVAASQSATVSLDKDTIDAVTAILSVATPRADGLAGVEPGASVSNAAVVVSGTLDRDLVGSERVALYDGDLRVGYATLGASGRNWTYAFTGMNNGAHNLTAVVENGAGRSGTHSGAFALTMAAQSPGQLATLTNGFVDGTPLGSAAGVDTHGFSVFVWNTNRTYWDINQLRNTANMTPTGSRQVPALDFGAFDRAFIPGIPYQVVANYLGGGWFHVDAQQAGMWSFRTPVSDDFATLSVDGKQVFTAGGYYAEGRAGSTELTPGWHYLRMEVGNTGGAGYWRLQWRRPGETDYAVARDVYTGPTEHALALGPTDKSHHVKLNFALSAPLGKDEQLQVIDLTAHRVGDGLRLQFWNLPADASRSFDAALALMAQTPAVVSRMADTLSFDRSSPFDAGVITSAASMLGHASGWFHVAQNQAGTWLFRTALSNSQVQLKIDGHTLQTPGEPLAHAQFATTHLEAGWHHIDTILFQGSDTAIDWRISVLRPGQNTYGLLTDFAQFETEVLGNASLADATQPTAYSFDTTVDDGGSHTLVAVVDNNGAHVALEDASESRVFLANGAFGIVDKAVAVTGDGQTVNFAAHGTINRIDLDADHATHTQGNTLVIGADDVRQADIGAAADLHSDLLNAAFHQLIVQGGQHDVLRLADAANATAWQESGTIAAATDTPAYTVFTAPDQALQLIVQTDIALDLNGVLRSTAHPVI